MMRVCGSCNVCRQPSFCNEQLAVKTRRNLHGLRLCFYAGWSVRRCHLRLAVISESYTEFADCICYLNVYITGNFPFHIDEVGEISFALVCRQMAPSPRRRLLSVAPALPHQ